MMQKRSSFDSMATGMTTPPPYYANDEKTSVAEEKPAFNSALGTRPTLHVKYKDWRARHGEIVDASTGQPIYTVEHRYRGPTFSLNNSSGSTLATACSSTWTMKMDMSIAGQDFQLTPRRKFGNTCTYISPAFGQQTLTWEYLRSCGRIEYVLVDENALPIARFQGGSSWKCMPWGSFGDFEFVDGRVESEAQRDEVVATGLTLAYKAYINKTSGSGSVVVVT